MDFLEDRLLYILLFIGALLGLDLGGSALRSILLGWHLVLSWLILTLPPGQYILSSFMLSKSDTVVSRCRSLKTRPYKLDHAVGTNHALVVYYHR